MKLMRITAILILVLSFFVSDVHAFDDSTGKTADELLNNTEESYDNFERYDSRFPATPKESRSEAGVSKDDAPLKKNPSLGYVGSPQEARETSSPSTSQASNATTSTNTGIAPSVNADAGVDLSGMWALTIGDLRADITLCQNQAAVFGTGNIRDGSSIMTLTASGDISGDMLELDMVTLGSVGMYRLVLTLSEDQLSGSYSEYGTTGTPTTGRAYGSRLKAANVITE